MESFCFVLIFTRLTAKEKKLHTICLDNEIFIKIPKRSNIFEVNISHFYTALVIIFLSEFSRYVITFIWSTPSSTLMEKELWIS